MESSPLKKKKWLGRLPLLLAFCLPFTIAFLVYAIGGVHPFGSKMILAHDQWHQYYPFFSAFREKLRSGGSLQYTWNVGMGTGYASLFAYYLASPLNWLCVIVPSSMLMDFFALLTVIKIACAGLFMAMFLRIAYRRNDFSIVFFGLMYAFCAWVCGYYWNNIWLDTFALLPLLIAGTVSLLRDGKFRLYIITLGLSLWCNYYIAYFCCIFVLLSFIFYCIVFWKGWKNFLRRFLRIGVCTVIGIALAAALLIPTLKAMQITYSAESKSFDIFSLNIVSGVSGKVPAGQSTLRFLWKETIPGIWSASKVIFTNLMPIPDVTKMEGLPNVYSSFAAVVLAIYFCCCGKIKLKEKLCSVFLLLFLLLSFISRSLDYVWHGFHFPNMLPYRFSFLFSFVVICMAYRAFTLMDSFKKWYLAIIVPVAGLLIWNVWSKEMREEKFLVAALLAAAGLLAFYLIYEKDRGSRVASLAAFGACVIGSAVLLVRWGMVYAGEAPLVQDADLIAKQPNKWPLVAGIAVLAGMAAFYLLYGKNMRRRILSLVTFGLCTVSSVALLVSWTIEHSKQGSLIMAIVVLAVMVLFFLIYGKQQWRRITAFGLLAAIITVEMSLCFSYGVKKVDFTSRNGYPKDGAAVQALLDKTEELEDGKTLFWRTEATNSHTLDDGALNNYNGVSIFTSSANVNFNRFSRSLGFASWPQSNRYVYYASSPFINAMCGIKYLLDREGNYSDTQYNTLIATEGGTNLLRNDYFISAGFMTDIEFEDFVAEEQKYNPIWEQNDMFVLATGVHEPLYVPVQHSELRHSDDNVTFEAGGTSGTQYSYNCNGASGRSSLSVVYRAETDGLYCATTKFDGVSAVSVWRNGTYLFDRNIKARSMFSIGWCSAGDEFSLVYFVDAGKAGTFSADVEMMDDNAFRRGWAELADEAWQLTEVSDTMLSGVISVKRDGLFYTSIPYEPGWTATVDGEAVELAATFDPSSPSVKLTDAVIAFPLSAGVHTVTLRYRTPGLTIGILISVAALIAFGILIWLRRKKAYILFPDPKADDPEGLEAALEQLKQQHDDRQISAKEYRKQRRKIIRNL